MKHRVRTWAGQHPLPGLDVTTDSDRTAAREVLDVARLYGEEEVSLITTGARPIKGVDAVAWAERELDACT